MSKRQDQQIAFCPDCDVLFSFGTEDTFKGGNTFCPGCAGRITRRYKTVAAARKKHPGASMRSS